MISHPFRRQKPQSIATKEPQLTMDNNKPTQMRSQKKYCCNATLRVQHTPIALDCSVFIYTFEIHITSTIQ